jgi:O-antigen ligase
MWVLGFATVSVSLGTAVAAFGRLGLYVLLLWLFARGLRFPRPVCLWTPRRWFARWEVLTLAAVGYMALSILWTTTEPTAALWAWSEHARLVAIPVLWFLIRSQAEARTLLQVFVGTQSFVLASSWLLILGVDVPWAIGEHPTRDFDVFGSYLEQSISEAITAFLVWHQRAWVFGRACKPLAMGVSAIALLHVVFFLPGRTGLLVTSVLLVVTVLQQFSARWVSATVLVAAMAALTVFGSSTAMQTKIVRLGEQFSGASEQRDRQISTDVRRAYWSASLRAISERPILGSGSGSWNTEYLRLNTVDLPNHRTIRDPHQMFLLWAVEGGIVGLALLCATLLSLFLQSRALTTHDARSLQAVLIALVVAGLTTSTIYGIGMGDLFCMAIGIMLCSDPSKPIASTGDHRVNAS